MASQLTMTASASSVDAATTGAAGGVGTAPRTGAAETEASDPDDTVRR